MTLEALDVSVVIPTHRRERLVLEAIASALGQQGLALEVIVVDDDPQASARAGVAAIADPRLRYIVRDRPSNGRPAFARNAGASVAAGRFLYFLDDDDILEPDALAQMLRAVQAGAGKAMAFGQVTPFGDDPAVLRQQQEHFDWARKMAARVRYPWQLAASMVYCPAILINSACIARRAAFEQIGGYDTSIAVCEDADFWSRMAMQGGFAYLDRPIVRYRTGAPSLMHDLVRDDPKLHESYRIIQGKFAREVGAVRALFMKIWARLTVRR